MHKIIICSFIFLLYSATLFANNKDKQKFHTESIFQMGNIAMAEGDYDAAIRYYRQILDNNPNLPRVRLELALAYFLNKEYQAAQFHFEFVRATPNLPDTVAQKVDIYLALIRQQKNWSLNFSLGIVPDSNLNNAGSQKQECINTIFGPLCRPLDTKKSDTGLHLTADADYYLRFTKRFGLRNTINIDLSDFPTSEFDDHSIHLASGPRYAFDNGEISLQPTIYARCYAGDFYNWGYGLQLNTGWQFGKRWLLSAGSQISKNNYHNDYINNALTGYNWGIFIQPRFYLNNKSFLFGSLQFNQTNAQIKSYGNDNIIYSLGYFSEFKWGFSLMTRLDFIDTNYSSAAWFVIDNKFQERTRQDKTMRFYARLSNNKINWKNIIPAISYTFTTRTSNIQLYEFDKHRIEFELIRRF